MPPKSKEPIKKSAPQIVRPSISTSSLLYIPEDVTEGFQERVETGIDWTLTELAARHHKNKCTQNEIPSLTFADALHNKIEKSILKSFLDDESEMSLIDQWETILPITMWDLEKFSNDEGKACFNSVNCITDNLVGLIKRAVFKNDRNTLRKDLKEITVLRVNDSDMTNLDDQLKEYKNLITLNLCGNYLNEINGNFLPSCLRSLELQANRIGDVASFSETIPSELLYIGLSRNLLNSDSLDALPLLSHLTVLDLGNNDIYHLQPVLDTISRIPSLTALTLAGNPCSFCAAYARTVISRLPQLSCLDSREILSTDQALEPFEPHPDDLRSSYFNFNIFRIMSVTQPPKTDKGAVTTFHVELELPLLDSTRRRFLMYRRYESLVELMPPPEDDDWTISRTVIKSGDSKTTRINGADRLDEGSSHASDIYKTLTSKNSREICHFTTFESARVQWNKLMTFADPTVRIFCPDLKALRDTFRTIITLKLIYSITTQTKGGKPDKKSAQSIKAPLEQRVVLATIRCALHELDWSQPSQHFHWDDSLGTEDAIHWGDGDLSVLQYTQAPLKATKGKQEPDSLPSRQQPPDNLTCHFGFGIETLRN